LPSIRKSSGWLAASAASGDIAANSKGSTDDLRNPLRFLVQLLFGDMDHLLASRTEIEVPPPIVLEGRPPAVSGVPIGFDRQPLSAPIEVDEMRPHPHIDLGRRQAETSAKRKEVQLEIAAAAFAFCLFVDRQAEEVRLPDRAAQRTRGDEGGSTDCRQSEVGDRLCWARDRDASEGRNCGG
jgi:hypothetical protein